MDNANFFNSRIDKMKAQWQGQGMGCFIIWYRLVLRRAGVLLVSHRFPSWNVINFFLFLQCNTDFCMNLFQLRLYIICIYVYSMVSYKVSYLFIYFLIERILGRRRSLVSSGSLGRLWTNVTVRRCFCCRNDF